MQGYKKLNIKRIVSLRKSECRSWFQIVYEWEDVISEMTGIPILSPAKSILPLRLQRLKSFLGFPLLRSGLSLEFVMNGSPIDHREIHRNTIPWIIDYFLSVDETKLFVDSLKKVPSVILSSREAFERVLTLGEEYRDKIIHVGLSLPDKWMPASEEEWIHKDYDLLLIGKVSQGFESYLKRYCVSHPGLRIAERRIENGCYNFYDVQHPETFVGNADTRENYMNLLRRSRVFIYTTPGIDGDKATNGLSQVTPRFLEALACGCIPVMKYADNPDTRFYELQNFSPSVESYEDFCKQMNGALLSKPDYGKIINYLQRHTTSQRVIELKQVFNI